MKVGRVKAYSPAEKAGLKTCDYIWQINGKEVFEMSHNDCVKEVKNASTMLSLNIERYVGVISVRILHRSFPIRIQIPYFGNLREAIRPIIGRNIMEWYKIPPFLGPIINHWNRFQSRQGYWHSG